jgi:hypothetical protein
MSQEAAMTFRDLIERSLGDFEEHLRQEKLEEPTIEMRLRGARQFASLLLGDSQAKRAPLRPREPEGKGDPTTRRFGGPK